MSRKEGIELILVAGCDGLQELYEQLRRLHEEHGCRDGHDVGAGTVAEVELDGEPSHIVLRIVRRIGIAAAERETSAYGHLFREVGRLRQLGRVRRRSERPREANAFGVGGAIASMLAEQTVQGIDEISWACLLRARSHAESSDEKKTQKRSNY